MLWLLPQYVVLTIGEILFSITSLSFAFTQAPESMKSVVQALYLLTTAAGDLIDLIVIAALSDKFSSQVRLHFPEKITIEDLSRDFRDVLSQK